MKKLITASLCLLTLSMQVQAQTFTYQGTMQVPLPAAAAPNWGTSATEVAALFDEAILANFQANPALDTVLSDMDDLMLAQFSTELMVNDPTACSHLPVSQRSACWQQWPPPNTSIAVLTVAAQKASAANLLRLEAAFGPLLMNYALPAAPAAVQAAYNAAAVPAPLPGSHYWLLGGNVPRPASSAQYLYDLFLEYYTQGPGGDPAIALQEMSRYARRKITNAGVIVTLVVGGITLWAAIVTIHDSPWTQELTDSANFWLDTHGNDCPTCLRAWVYVGPTPLLPTPTPPDAPVPDLPPIEPDPTNVDTLPAIDAGSGNDPEGGVGVFGLDSF